MCSMIEARLDETRWRRGFAQRYICDYPSYNQPIMNRKQVTCELCDEEPNE